MFSTISARRRNRFSEGTRLFFLDRMTQPNPTHRFGYNIDGTTKNFLQAMAKSIDPAKPSEAFTCCIFRQLNQQIDIRVRSGIAPCNRPKHTQAYNAGGLKLKLMCA